MSLGTDTPFTMPVVPASSTSGNGNGNGWGNDGSWWIIILFLFIFAGGWNRGGWGGNGNGGSTPSGSGAIDNYVLASDFAQVERKLDTVQQGLCDGFYATAQQINGVNTAILTNGNATQMAIMPGQQRRPGTACRLLLPDPAAGWSAVLPTPTTTSPPSPATPGTPST